MVARLSALRTGRLNPPRKCSWYSFLLEAESTPGPQCDRKDFMSMKNPTPAGIEPATFRFVAQHLNHCATAVPIGLTVNDKKEKCVMVSTSEVRRRPQNLLVGEKNFEGIPSFIYLGAQINSRNDAGQSISKRTPSGH